MLRATDPGIAFRPSVVVLGAVAGGIIAMAPTLRRAGNAEGSADTAAGLA
jgi:hypothetical protein